MTDTTLRRTRSIGAVSRLGLLVAALLALAGLTILFAADGKHLREAGSHGRP